MPLMMLWKLLTWIWDFVTGKQAPVQDKDQASIDLKDKISQKETAAKSDTTKESEELEELPGVFD